MSSCTNRFDGSTRYHYSTALRSLQSPFRAICIRLIPPLDNSTSELLKRCIQLKGRSREKEICLTSSFENDSSQIRTCVKCDSIIPLSPTQAHVSQNREYPATDGMAKNLIDVTSNEDASRVRTASLLSECFIQGTSCFREMETEFSLLLLSTITLCLFQILLFHRK